MHKIGIIHGDLHDKNIMLKKEDDEVIDISFIDFDYSIDYSIDFINEDNEELRSNISELYDLEDNSINTLIEHDKSIYLNDQSCPIY